LILKKKDCRVRNGLLTELGACAYLIPDSLNWGRDLFRFRGDILGNWWKV
jgi:hypothetical protein